MKLTLEDVRGLARAVDLDIPEPELNEVFLRLQSLMLLMEEVESEIGTQLDSVEPVPPILPVDDLSALP